MQKLIANLTENARLFAETRKLLGSGGKILEVVEDEQEQAPEIAGEFYPGSANGASTEQANGGNGASVGTTPDGVKSTVVSGSEAESRSTPPSNPDVGANGNGSGKRDQPTAPAAKSNGNGSAPAVGFNQLRNEFLTAARRMATATNRPIGHVVEQASKGTFKYGDIGRLTEADTPKLRAAVELMTSSAGEPAH